MNILFAILLSTCAGHADDVDTAPVVECDDGEQVCTANCDTFVPDPDACDTEVASNN